jgi:hypothetical protein
MQGSTGLGRVTADVTGSGAIAETGGGTFTWQTVFPGGLFFLAMLNGIIR